jgi:hypothetical protein
MSVTISFILPFGKQAEQNKLRWIYWFSYVVRDNVSLAVKDIFIISFP